MRRRTLFRVLAVMVLVGGLLAFGAGAVRDPTTSREKAPAVAIAVIGIALVASIFGPGASGAPVEGAERAKKIAKASRPVVPFHTPAPPLVFYEYPPEHVKPVARPISAKPVRVAAPPVRALPIQKGRPVVRIEWH